MDEAELRRKIQQFTWYHTIQLTPNVATPGWPVIIPIVEMTLKALRALDLRGKRVLDIGCRDGLFSFEAERLRASEVVGIDSALPPTVTEFLAGFFGSRAKFESRNLFDLDAAADGTFDTIIFAGVLYHLRYPFEALKLLRGLLEDGSTLLIETGILVDDNRHAMMFCPVGEESPYEPTSCTFFNLKGLRDTLASMGFAVESATRLMNLEHPAGQPLPDKPAIDRCVMVCRKVPAPDPQTTAYWAGALGAYDIVTRRQSQSDLTARDAKETGDGQEKH